MTQPAEAGSGTYGPTSLPGPTSEAPVRVVSPAGGDGAAAVTLHLTAPPVPVAPGLYQRRRKPNQREQERRQQWGETWGQLLSDAAAAVSREA